MKIALIISAALLTGCATNPEVQKSLSRDQTMDKMAKTALINEMLKVVVQNYGMYYECAAKVDGWNDWYLEQKRIYESVK